MNKNCVFIGGKQIGVNCLKQLLYYNLIPKLIFTNITDNGQDIWHDSLIKFAHLKQLPVMQCKRLNDHEIIEKIKKINPEIIFCIGSTQIIPEEILKIPSLGCLNIHPALLPKYRGRFSTVHAIFNGEKKTGVTLHWMDKGIDTGPIIMQKSFPITNSDTAKTLYNKFTEAGENLFIIFLKKWMRGEKILSKRQNEKQSSYYPMQLPNNGHLDWNWNGKKILRFIRAMTFEPFPPVEFNIGDKKMVIVDRKYYKI